MSAQPNDRIRLDYTNDEYTHLRPGAEGTVTGVTVGEFAQVRVRWDDGSNLSLLPDIDRYTVIGHSNVS